MLYPTLRPEDDEGKSHRQFFLINRFLNISSSSIFYGFFFLSSVSRFVPRICMFRSYYLCKPLFVAVLTFLPVNALASVYSQCWLLFVDIIYDKQKTNKHFVCITYLTSFRTVTLHLAFIWIRWQKCEPHTLKCKLLDGVFQVKWYDYDLHWLYSIMWYVYLCSHSQHLCSDGYKIQ